MRILCLVIIGLATLGNGRAQVLRRPVPNKVVVLTFDDGAASHITRVAPLLKKYGFGGTFFVCEFPPDFADKRKYMSWAQIQELYHMGFEVGSHTLTHRHVTKMSDAQFVAELDSLEGRCLDHGIPQPVTFAYPGYDTNAGALNVLQVKGYQFARAGGSRAYNPAADHPYLIPSFSSGPNRRTVLRALQEARNGHIVVLTVHGVPDYAHAWVTTPPTVFKAYLRFLHRHHYTVIALRDLARYVDVSQALKTITPQL